MNKINRKAGAASPASYEDEKPMFPDWLNAAICALPGGVSIFSLEASEWSCLSRSFRRMMMMTTMMGNFLLREESCAPVCLHFWQSMLSIEEEKKKTISENAWKLTSGFLFA